MIDTIQIINRYKEEDKSILQDFFNNMLTPQSSTEYLNGYKGICLRGTYANWTFTLGLTNYKIIGSLNTASKGNNIYNYSFEEMTLALYELQEYFCLDLSKAKISKIDIGYNCIVQHNVYNYFKSILSPKTYKGITYENETLSFIGNGGKITFYDKVAESKANKKLPFNYKNLNVLRYELRLNNSSLKTIGFKNLLFEDLYNELHYETLINHWLNSYVQLNKVTKFKIPILKSGKVREFRDFVLAKFLNVNENQNELNSYLKSKFLTPKQRVDIKREISRVQKETVYSDMLEAELRQQLVLAYCKN